jgi:hypothetical protein
MPASFAFYNGFSEYVADNTIDLDGDTFKVVLLADSYTFDATDDGYADLSGELATANGYTQNDKTLATVGWTRSGSTSTFDAADTEWTASGGSIVAKFAVVFSDTSTGDKLVCCVTLDSSAVTATTGNKLTLVWNASGIFTLAPAA